MPEEGCGATEVVELLEILPNAGGAVVGGAAAANPPPKDGATDVVLVEPNDGAEVVDPNPNFGAAGAPPKAGVAADAPDEAPPNVNALVVDDGAVVATAGVATVPAVDLKAKLPPEVAPLTPVVDAATLPNDGILEVLVVTTAAEEAFGESGLKALNPDPLPKAGMAD